MPFQWQWLGAVSAIFDCLGFNPPDVWLCFAADNIGQNMPPLGVFLLYCNHVPVPARYGVSEEKLAQCKIGPVGRKDCERLLNP